MNVLPVISVDPKTVGTAHSRNVVYLPSFPIRRKHLSLKWAQHNTLSEDTYTFLGTFSFIALIHLAIRSVLRVGNLKPRNASFKNELTYVLKVDVLLYNGIHKTIQNYRIIYETLHTYGTSDSCLGFYRLRKQCISPIQILSGHYLHSLSVCYAYQWNSFPQNGLSKFLLYLKLWKIHWHTCSTTNASEDPLYWQEVCIKSKKYLIVEVGFKNCDALIFSLIQTCSSLRKWISTLGIVCYTLLCKHNLHDMHMYIFYRTFELTREAFEDFQDLWNLVFDK